MGKEASCEYFYGFPASSGWQKRVVEKEECSPVAQGLRYAVNVFKRREAEKGKASNYRPWADGPHSSILPAPVVIAIGAHRL